MNKKSPAMIFCLIKFKFCFNYSSSLKHFFLLDIMLYRIEQVFKQQIRIILEKMRQNPCPEVLQERENLANYFVILDIILEGLLCCYMYIIIYFTVYIFTQRANVYVGEGRRDWAHVLLSLVKLYYCIEFKEAFSPNS